MQSSTPSIKRESLSPKTLELAMHPQETNWNESHVHKQRRYFNKANQIFIYFPSNTPNGNANDFLYASYRESSL